MYDNTLMTMMIVNDSFARGLKLVEFGRGVSVSIIIVVDKLSGGREHDRDTPRARHQLSVGGRWKCQ